MKNTKSKAVNHLVRPWIFLWGLLLVFLPSPRLVVAQTLTFCRSHSTDGKPLGASDTFELKKPGQPVEFLFDNEKPLFSPRLYFFVDHWQNGRFEEYDTKTAIVQHGATWAAIEYRFTTPGAYRVQVLDAEKKVICHKQIGIAILQNEDTPAYFEGSKIIVCTAAPNGKPIDSLTTYKQSPANSTMLTILMRHLRPLGTSRVIVDVWTGPGNDEDIYLETIELATEPDWMHMQFKYEFKGMGHYTLRLYNENEVYIGTCTLSIESR